MLLQLRVVIIPQNDLEMLHGKRMFWRITPSTCMAGEGLALAQLSLQAFPHFPARMMENTFLEADGSGRSLFCLCGSCSSAGSVAALGCCCSAEMGMAGGCRFVLAPCSMAHQSQRPEGEHMGRMTQGHGSRGHRERGGSQTKLADEIFVPREGQDAATGSHLMEDTSRLGANLHELCLCLGWPSGRCETEGGDMANNWAPTVAKAWPGALPG